MSEQIYSMYCFYPDENHQFWSLNYNVRNIFKCFFFFNKLANKNYVFNLICCFRHLSPCNINSSIFLLPRQPRWCVLPPIDMTGWYSILRCGYSMGLIKKKVLFLSKLYYTILAIIWALTYTQVQMSTASHVYRWLRAAPVLSREGEYAGICGAQPQAPVCKRPYRHSSCLLLIIDWEVDIFWCSRCVLSFKWL